MPSGGPTRDPELAAWLTRSPSRDGAGAAPRCSVALTKLRKRRRASASGAAGEGATSPRCAASARSTSRRRVTSHAANRGSRGTGAPPIPWTYFTVLKMGMFASVAT